MSARLIQYLLVNSVIPNPAQPRRTFDQDALVRLAQTIKTEGVLQPVRVRRHNDGTWMLVFGERRWRAAKLAGVETIPAVVDEEDVPAASSDRIRQLVENSHESVPPLELAEAIEAVISEEGLSAAEVARRIGLSEGHVSKLRALHKGLSPEMQEAVAQGKLGLKAAYEVAASQKNHRATGQLARKVKNAQRARRLPRKKVTLSVAKGCSVAVVAPAFTLNVLAEWLADLAERARAAQQQGVTVEAFAELLRRPRSSSAEAQP